LRSCPDIQSRAVALNPSDGAIVAMVARFDFTDEVQITPPNRAVKPGSGFKPFVYSAALDRG